jgi:hypothetical protein
VECEGKRPFESVAAAVVGDPNAPAAGPGTGRASPATIAGSQIPIVAMAPKQTTVPAAGYPSTIAAIDLETIFSGHR